MYCKNCGNEVIENAIACLKCGMSPKSEKNFCGECGTATNPKQIVCTSCGVSLKSNIFNELTTQSNFPIPLWLGFIVNFLAWLIFVTTDNHGLEFFMGILCLSSAYVGYVHKKRNSDPAFELNFLNANYLIYISVFDAIWIIYWSIANS